MAAAPSNLVFIPGSAGEWGTSPFNSPANTQSYWLNPDTGQNFPATAFDVQAPEPQLNLSDVNIANDPQAAAIAAGTAPLDATSSLHMASIATATPNGPTDPMYALNEGQIGNIGDGTATGNAFGLSGPNAAYANDPALSGNLGDMSFTSANYGFGGASATSPVSTPITSDPNSAGVPSIDTPSASASDPGSAPSTSSNANANDVPHAIDQQSQEQAQSASTIAKAETQAAGTVAKATTAGDAAIAKGASADTQAQLKSTSSWIGNIENWFTSIFARGGFVLLGIVFAVIGLYMLAKRENITLAPKAA